MDRLAGHIDNTDSRASGANDSAFAFGEGEEHLLQESALHSAIDPGLFELDELEVLYEAHTAALWTYMTPVGRPSFTPPMLRDFESWQRLIAGSFGPDKVPLRYLVLGSRAPGVFCFGGDLQLFHKLIETGNRQGLAQYGFRCVEILYRNMHSLDLPMLTIGLVEGAALGGGFEALLSFDFLIAERGATFGLPEVLFGLFPGMGAHALLSRKLGSAMANRLILSNETYTAEQMYELGIVHQLVEPGEGLKACREFIKRSERRHLGLVNSRKAMKRTRAVELSELKDIVELWADAALQLSAQDLKVMSRLTRAQERLAASA
ncbi:enoyl-CoA hydratase [Altererythrobacter soli]|uniref:Enoyl-CoA hydratase n=1 Tax=Croceibacterium soli TaxID=1739690 RepID=A0A6I4UYS1_9SPHN|nr:crotonase/enoyl-CoA hydratase family protein [Croceibacterium soli]MXP42397.1 enoyl-CoA hydratase [Croceibacterium soli]